MIAEDFTKLVRYMQKRIAANKTAYDKSSTNYQRAIRAGLQPQFIDNVAAAVRLGDEANIKRYGHGYTSHLARREMLLAKLAGNTVDFAYWRGIAQIHLNIYLGELELTKEGTEVIFNADMDDDNE